MEQEHSRLSQLEWKPVKQVIKGWLTRSTSPQKNAQKILTVGRGSDGITMTFINKENFVQIWRDFTLNLQVHTVKLKYFESGLNISMVNSDAWFQNHNKLQRLRGEAYCYSVTELLMMMEWKLQSTSSSAMTIVSCMSQTGKIQIILSHIRSSDVQSIQMSDSQAALSLVDCLVQVVREVKTIKNIRN